MAECSNGASQQVAEVNMLNSKLGYDFAAQLQNQALIDNQGDARAWNELKLSEARDTQTIKYLASVAALATDQTGQTENQQNTSPIGQATAEAIKASPGVSADAVTASVANLATSLVPVIASSLATAISEAMTAVLPALVTAVGGASTPSQTQPKPTA